VHHAAPTRRTKRRYDERHYKNRNVIERFFGRIKQYRRVATRYDKKPETTWGLFGSPLY
jgi:transposase